MLGGSTTDVPRLIAFYLPQFHPIEVNDLIHGRGYTEWTAVASAQPLFRGHRQPRTPTDLGFYDLRVPEARVAQAELAARYGISAFCYWHYWSDGARTMERPLDDVLASGEPDLPFCIGWANHDWRETWGDQRLVLQQRYPGATDEEAHFRALETAFHDPRYVTVDGAPLVFIFRPREIPDLHGFTDRWRRLAEHSGLSGVHFVAQLRTDDSAEATRSIASAVDACVVVPIGPPTSSRTTLRTIADRLRGGPIRLDYRQLAEQARGMFPGGLEAYPAVLTNWDNTPRWGRSGFVLEHDEPEHLRRMVRDAVELVAGRAADRQIVFVKSWNEWAEGNFLEPDLADGTARLEAISAALSEARRSPSGTPATH
jgi:hypothetical protein